MFNRIQGSPAAAVAAQNLKNANQDFATSLERLASGVRINQPGDDPSGLAISGELESDLRGGQQGERNLVEAGAMFDVAEGALSEISNLLIRTRELAIQAASNTVDDVGRNAIQFEAKQSLQALEQIVMTTHFGSRMLLTSGDGGSFTFQYGKDSSNASRLDFDLSVLDVRSGTLGLSDAIDLQDPDSALDSIGTIDEAIGRVETTRAAVGAYQSRVESARTLLAGTSTITAARLSRIRDTDYAEEVAKKFAAEARVKAAIAVLSQANLQSGQVLKLLEPH